MKIAIIGPGAMGMLFGGNLSKENEVYLVGRNVERTEKIKADGVHITEKDGTENHFFPNASSDGMSVGEVDVAILLVKAMHSREALSAHRTLIGENTILLGLQNGAGHENLLQEFAKAENIAIGTTGEGCFVKEINHICHTGVAPTAFAMLNGDNARLEPLVKTMCSCGLESFASDNIKEVIWKKLLINSSTSALSAMLGVPQGYCADNKTAWSLAEQLVREILAVAKAEGVEFDEAEQMQRVKANLENARSGRVSLLVDLSAGRLTEIDTISGAVIKAGKKYGVPTPVHDVMVQVIHAMENKNSYDPMAY